MNRIKEGDSQVIAEVDYILQFGGRHGRRAREGETFLMR